MSTGRKQIFIGAAVIIIVIILFALLPHGPKGSQYQGSSNQLDQNNFNATSYHLFGDTFSLDQGKTLIQGHSGLDKSGSEPLIPVSYTLAASASGDITGTGVQGTVVALYRGFGANIEWVTLFAVTGNNQVASTVVMDNGAPVQDASVQSVAVNNGIVTLNLLVISQADQQLPHYEQRPTVPLMLKYTISNGQFVNE